MTLTPQTRLKNAERELAQAEREFAIAQEGRQRLNEVLEQHQAEHAAALQDWSRDKSEANVSRMTTARSQLNAVRELLQEDVLPYAKAETELERCQEQLTRAKCVIQAIELAEGLQRQQDYFAADAQELQRQIVELLDRMRKTADGWDAMHQRQFQLAQEAGLSPVQLQRKVEAWGFDANPLKRVLVRSPMDGNDTLVFRVTYNWPDAVDGSDLAQYAKRLTQQGILDHYNGKFREAMRPARSSYTPRPTLTAYQEEQAEERELARLAAQQRKAAQQAELEADRLEAQQDREYGAKPIFDGRSIITHIPAASGGDDDE